ncbi:MAG TPA: NADH-quinone oxidoreductase subunit M [Acidobacteriaceae bacterium]|jgi:NADH-quinone oxidoreductase subunit M|nr:NADH-quinone oxidoreductase subunit M [Acidobacteriaceae bacterium]
MITLLTLLPLVGGLLVLLLGHERALARLIAMLFGVGALVIACFFWIGYEPAYPGMQFEVIHQWAPSLGMTYHVGVDGLGVLMLVLSALVVTMSLAASWGNEKHGRLYFALVLFLECGLFGTFTALNFVHWFIYWELSLIPAFFLVRLWGGPQRARAATQFFLYTMVGSVALLLAFLALFLGTGQFDFVQLAQLGQTNQLTAALAQNLHWTGNPQTLMLLIFWGAFLGFAVKTAVIPFHTWLPLAYSEASSETTMLLTGAMSKMGVYGFLRILLPIFPQQMQQELKPLLWMAVATIVLPAFAAWAQKDLKRTFAYSSINHLGYCVLGICVAARFTGADPGMAHEKAAALTGVLLQMFSHGLTASALFWFIALLERRSGGVRGIDDFGGLRRVVPVFSGLMGIAIFASLGLPGLNGFPGEFLIFKGAFPLVPWATAVSVLGLLMTAVFLLTVIQKVFSGPVNPRWAAMPDLTVRERLVLLPVIGVMFLIGLYPQIITGMVHVTVAQWVAGVRF